MQKKNCEYTCNENTLECFYSCDGVPSGSYLLTVSDSALKQIRGTFRKGKEFGGTMDVYMDDPSSMKGSLELSNLTDWGKTDRVNLSHGMFEFHTHPSKCDQKSCYMDPPSSMDISIVSNDWHNGNVVHFVFSRDGTYAMSVDDSTRNRLREVHSSRGRRAMESEIEKMVDQAKQLEAEFDDMNGSGGVPKSSSRSVRDAFRSRYISRMKRAGVTITFFPNEINPSVRVPVT